jgi:hypothetical protein
MVSLDFIIDIPVYPSGRTMALELTQPLTKISTRNVSCGYRWPVPKADKLTIFMCRLSRNLGASNSWNPQGLSRPVMGLLYLLPHINTVPDALLFITGTTNVCSNITNDLIIH